VENQKLTHTQRMEKCLSGELPDRPPVALWRHFPVDDQSPGSLTRAVVHYQRTYDFDLVKVTPASSYCIKDWGVNDRWTGNPEGTRDYTENVIVHPEDWEKLKPLDPRKGYLGAQLESLKLIVDELGNTAPILQTIFNPLAQAKNLVSASDLLVHLRQYPDAVHGGLKVIAQTTADFMEACLSTGIAGFFYAVQHAQLHLLNPQEYRIFGEPYDRQVLKAAGPAWLNMLHLHGNDVMFDLFLDYPVQIINWHDRDTWPSLKEAQARFPGVVCGGLSRWSTMVLGMPAKIDAEATDAVQQTGGRRFVLGTGCVVPVLAPHGNLTAARHALEAVPTRKY
jgi:uroporphyrinogen decarboxylase